MSERVRHIGIFRSVCGAVQDAHLRSDLSFAEYARLGVRVRFKEEKQYRVCARCLSVIKKKEAQP